MANVTTAKRNKFEPIVIELDGRKIEICACGQTKNADRTCDGTHHEVNAKIEKSENDPRKTMTVEEVLAKLNTELNVNETDKHECACGGNCGCGGN